MGSRSGTIHSIPVGNVKSKRNQVLSLLKGAIVDDGEIYLEMYVFVNRILPPIESKYFRGISLEATDSCIHVIRRYRFSYVDINTQKCRCFSKYPLDSILTGVFFDVAGAHSLTYSLTHLTTYSLTQMPNSTCLSTRRTCEKSPSPTASTRRTTYFTEILTSSRTPSTSASRTVKLLVGWNG
jgi:hypothetical protein